MTGPKINDPDIERTYERAGVWLRAGHSYRDTEKRFDLPISQLRKRLPGLGYKGQRKPGPSEEQLAEASRLFEGGMSRQDVHRVTGISIPMLTKHFPDNKWGKSDVVLYAKARRVENQITDEYLRTV